MARGFASKSVADLQEEEFHERAPLDERESPETIRTRRSLELARADIEARLKSAHTKAHRELLERSRAALDQQLAALRAKRG